MEGVYDPFRIDTKLLLGWSGYSMVSTVWSPCGLKTGGSGFFASHTCRPDPKFVFGHTSISRKQNREYDFVIQPPYSGVVFKTC